MGCGNGVVLNKNCRGDCFIMIRPFQLTHE
uniref:Uncharacterized protein n=1 Tax=Anguilla anguilla TaxID=7936 RepID=A0A0E9Q5W7_ANGAN